jgi:acetyl esterase/lipase
MKNNLKYLLLLFSIFNIYNVHGQTRSNKILLWPASPPDGPGPAGAEHVSDKGSVTNVSSPRLIVHRPAHPNGVAMLVISGGGYAHIEAGNESGPAANWLQEQGITAFELIYRLPEEGWASNNVPFEDAQRAMRLIRSKAAEYGLDPHKIGIMGFSAGGHLAGMTETEYDKQWYAPIDHVDSHSARPNFIALLYPIISMLPPYDHTHSEKEILGKNPSTAQQKAYSVELHVKEKTPPTFLAQAIDDPISNVENSRLMYAALQQNHVPSEIHLFPTGGHGWGMGKPGSPEQEWPQLFKAWAKANGFWQ